MSEKNKEQEHIFWEQNLSEHDIRPLYTETPFPTVTIAWEEYEKLLKDSTRYQNLIDHGVEHWQGYEKAIDNL